MNHDRAGRPAAVQHVTEFILLRVEHVYRRRRWRYRTMRRRTIYFFFFWYTEKPRRNLYTIVMAVVASVAHTSSRGGGGWWRGFFCFSSSSTHSPTHNIYGRRRGHAGKDGPSCVSLSWRGDDGRERGYFIIVHKKPSARITFSVPVKRTKIWNRRRRRRRRERNRHLINYDCTAPPSTL